MEPISAFFDITSCWFPMKIRWCQQNSRVGRMIYMFFWSYLGKVWLCQVSSLYDMCDRFQGVALFAPHPWTASKRPILNSFKNHMARWCCTALKKIWKILLLFFLLFFSFFSFKFDVVNLFYGVLISGIKKKRKSNLELQSQRLLVFYRC